MLSLSKIIQGLEDRSRYGDGESSFSPSWHENQTGAEHSFSPAWQADQTRIHEDTHSSAQHTLQSKPSL